MRDEIRAPSQTPGIAPTRMLPASPNWKSPKSRWPTEADATSGTACTMSVPTSRLVRIRG